LRKEMIDPLQNRGLNDLIEELQTSGATDSSGVFTISSEKAREKLSQFALPDPRFYVLNLIASAVAAGATNIEIRVTAERLLFDYDGEPLNPSDLAALWNQLLNPQRASLHELAVAMNAARSLGPVELSLESWNGDQGCRLDVEGDTLKVQPLHHSSWERACDGHRITVREGARKKTARWFFGIPERGILRANSHLGPAKVVLDGRELSRSVSAGQSPRSAAWLHLVDGPARLRANPPEPSWAPACMVVGPTASAARYEAVLALGPAEVCEKEGLMIVCNGIAFSRPASWLGCSFACGVVFTGELRKNLSHTDLAEDEAYQELLNQLRWNVESLIVSRLEHPHPLPAELASIMLLFAPILAQRLRARELPEAAQVVDRWVKEAEFVQNTFNLSLWQALCAELLELGDSPSGQALQQRLERALRETGEGLFETGQTLKSVQCWERLVELGELSQSPWLAREAENLAVLRALCGVKIEPSDCPSPERRAAMLRLLGRPGDALQYCSCPQSRAESLLALGQIDEAETLLREILLTEPSVLAAETLSDLLAFGMPREPLRRKEGFQWREHALGLRAAEHPAFDGFLREDVAQLARATLPFYKFLHYRLQASSAQIAASMAEVAKAMEEGRQLLHRKSLGTLRLKSALLTAETKFTPNHPFLDVARGRAAHILRASGEWLEADDLLARGQLIQSLYTSWDSERGKS
jgi:hypothetical protein